MIGSALAAYSFKKTSRFVLGDSAPQFAVLPVDMAGRWFGAFTVRFWGLPNEDLFPVLDVNNNAGGRLAIELRVAGVVVQTSQVWNKRQWRPIQRYHLSGTTYQLQSWNISTPNGTIEGPSYQNAYFPPTTAANNATPSTTPAAHTHVLAVHPEPIYAWFDRDDGQLVDMRLRLFADRPNSTLSNPINDDAPPADLSVRDAEETIAPNPTGPSQANFIVDAWFMRIGPTGLEAVADIPNDPTWSSPPPA